MKKCRKCGEVKELKFFSRSKETSDGHGRWCKSCNSLYSRDYRQSHESRREEWLKSRYGISAEDYEKILIAQQEGCWICGAKDPGHKKKNFCVDHNHVTGKIRGLLCYPCNCALGLFQDRVDRLQQAIQYLQKD